MCKKEIIRLDATVVDVIANSVFRAILSNGHEVIAYMSREDRHRAEEIKIGTQVELDMSPYDMSKGCITLNKEKEA